MAIYFGSQRLGSIQIGAVDKSFQYVDLSTPTIDVDSLGVITASVLQATAGYVYSSATTSTYSLQTVPAVTVIPNSTTQTLAIGGKCTLGDLAVSPVPTEVQTVTYVGSYYATSGTYISSFNVDIPIYNGAIIT